MSSSIQNRFSPLRAGVFLLMGLAALLMAGCVTPPKPERAFEPPSGHWSGRFALTVDSQPPQSYSASFTLAGGPQAGELTLTSPLGSTLAVMQWQPGLALLRQGEQTYSFASLDELTAAAAGADLPVRALFGWLGGSAQTVEGWSADLSRLPEHRLTARRLTPPPAAELRLVLDYPKNGS
ncbi:MAG: outer membrane lipoprotein LolB [Desulfovibrionaceae bacterium]|nr:outer membrane lipoprotein LolB [Desulfovibrionaceae bacterium]